jgi:hypothetical protein
MGNVPQNAQEHGNSLYQRHQISISKSLETIEGTILLLQYVKFLPVQISCSKCPKEMTIRPCSRAIYEDRVCYKCVDKCQGVTSIRGQLLLPCPKSLSLIAYATTIFEYFPRGINANQLEREIESNHQPSHLSKPTALQFLDNLRKCIR